MFMTRRGMGRYISLSSPLNTPRSRYFIRYIFSLFHNSDNFFVWSLIYFVYSLGNCVTWIYVWSLVRLFDSSAEAPPLSASGLVVITVRIMVINTCYALKAKTNTISIIMKRKITKKKKNIKGSVPTKGWRVGIKRIFIFKNDHLRSG